jgi:hypothetical protein
MHCIIVGTDHDLQKVDSADEGLAELLTTLMGNADVVLIAEEVDANKDVISFGRELSKKLLGEGRWVSIDMDDDRRREAGIDAQLRTRTEPGLDAENNFCIVNRYFRYADGLRENFWLDRIEEKCQALGITDGTVLITCGYIHDEFLSDKATKRGHTVTVKRYLPYDPESKHGKSEICD